MRHLNESNDTRMKIFFFSHLELFETESKINIHSKNISHAVDPKRRGFNNNNTNFDLV